MTAPKRKKKPSQSYLTRKADTAFSKWIRQRDGHCVNCGSTAFLQCAHGFTRARFGTRWSPFNAWALCRECHVRFTHRPDEWTVWMIDRLGREAYDALYLRSVQPWRGDKNEIAAHYTALFKEAA